MRPQIWVTGAGGFIASYLLQTATRFAPAFEVVGWKRPAFDLLDFKSMDKAFAETKPAAIIHCAALSRTIDCQENPDLARRINVEGTRHLVDLAGDLPVIFFSSDLVFDGLKGDYVEPDPVNPRSVYGETKAEAETIVLRNPRHTVVRTSLTAGSSPSGSRTFNEEIKQAWQTGRTMVLFKDEFRCPLGAPVTARAVWELFATGQRGLFHLTGAERLSRLEIGQVLARRWGYPQANIHSASIGDYKGPPRCPDTSLNCARIQSHLSFPLPRFSEWVAENPTEIP